VHRGSTFLDVNPTEIGPLDALGFHVRVADVVGHPTLLAANCAGRCHKSLRKGG
jgi:hypothetical protein